MSTNRLARRFCLSSESVAEHEHLRFVWCNCLGPVIGPSDAAVLFTTLEVVDRASDRIDLARHVLFMTSYGVEQSEIDRVILRRALDVCSVLLARNDPEAVLTVVAWDLNVDRLTRIACRLRDSARTTEPKDTKP